ncbi:MAG TPA: ACT domain-containing protein [Casimicrobiaceae bacterium]|nr:ACT domain-containing protein [Casimicrobiaceae bacterium]
MAKRLSLTLLPDSIAICRLEPQAAVPEWVTSAPWWSMTRTTDEFSIVCAERCVPEGIVASRGWRALRFAGPLPLDQTGILASVTTPLAAARVSVFALATYDTDYVLIPAAQRAAAIEALERAGHSVGSAGY